MKIPFLNKVINKLTSVIAKDYPESKDNKDGFLAAVPNNTEQIDITAKERVSLKEDDSLAALLWDDPALLASLDKTPSEAFLLKLIPDNPFLFQYVPSPSERFISDALAINGQLLYDVVNPTQAQALIAIKSEPLAIKCIDSPSELLQIEAVKGNYNALESIKHPATDILHKAGWIIFDPSSEHSFKELPDQISVTIENLPNYCDFPSYSTVTILLDDKLKNDLLTTGSAYLDFDDSPRFDISGGHQLVILNKDGTMNFDQETCKVEGGSVNYYHQNVRINKHKCKLKSELLLKDKHSKKASKHRR